jgi:steroid delta-isomerase-like uncharacterized protein
MTSSSQITIADRVIAAFNQGDWNQLATIFSPDIAYTETGTNRAVQGAEAYMQLLAGWRHVFPDCTGTIQTTVAEGNLVVHQVCWEGTQAAPLPTPGGEVPNQGRKIRVNGSLWYTIDRARVTAIHHQLDVFTMLQQLGAFDQQPQP